MEWLIVLLNLVVLHQNKRLLASSPLNLSKWEYTKKGAVTVYHFIAAKGLYLGELLNRSGARDPKIYQFCNCSTTWVEQGIGA